ncbi:Sortase (surface protein transpeptidase) [Pseudobutyrivibrio sp. OR37]|uniref:sortase n=1 Tax=Pseudobutyrivibrio sp. OR37 TaxID=1798186 RepID=UPI0008F2C194|nr:sortase [Pseudobutyrivibrio sp. OR37]SFH52811.1 Sortase (surface protein transpeptidase) [Pseudobutyrivibrio sp. OR37]
MLKRVWKKYMNYILIGITGSMLLLFAVSNVITVRTFADEGELPQNEAEVQSEEGITFTEDAPVQDAEGGDNVPENQAGEADASTGEGGNTAIGDTTAAGSDGAVTTGEGGAGGTGTEGGESDAEGSGTASDGSGTTQEGEGTGTGTEGEEGEKEGEGTEETENKDDEEKKCICETHCTSAEFNEECPVCKKNFEDCAILDKDECTCKTHCSEEDVDSTCPVCAKDYTQCAFEEVCICEKKCKEGKVDLNCPVCAKDYAECIGKEEDYAAIIAYSVGGESKEAEFLTLEEALNGARAVADEVHNDGDSNFIPVIEIKDELSIASSMTVVNNCTFVIDMKGHKISLDSGAYIDFASSRVTLKDSTATEINYSGDNYRPGGISGTSGKLFAGTDYIKFESGYYNISSGTICSGFADIDVYNAYLINSSGNIADTDSKLTVNGGFFVYEDLFNSENAGTLVCPEKMILAEMSVSISGYEVRGYGLSNALFKVTLQLLGESEFYYSTFAEAFEAATNMSRNNDGAKAIVSINDPAITNVAISQTYTMSSNSNGYSPVVQVNNINFTRGGADVIFDGTMFAVGGGELILSDCSLNGFIAEDQVAVSSMITVDDGAALSLIGSSEVGTSLVGNVALLGATASDPGAGAYLRSGATLKVNGNIILHNNVSYSETANADGGIDTARINRNLYMDEGAIVLVEGPLIKTESFLIGVTMAAEEIDLDAAVGALGTDYYNSLVAAGSNDMDLSAFYMDTSAAYFMVYDYGSNTIKWSRGSALLPEAGVFRLEYVLLFVGLIGFIFRALWAAKDDRKEIVRYITVMSVTCLVGGMCFGAVHVYNDIQRIRTNNEIIASMAEVTDNSNLGDNEEVTEESVAEVTSVGDTSTFKVVEEPQPEKAMVPADGREYIGVIEIDRFGIKLPVLATYTDADMKTTPCVYNGSRENGNLVIVGHNYDSQFGDFNLLGKDEVITAKLTTLDGTVYEYESTLIENLNPDQIDEMLSGQWDLTLFTCSYSGEKRITVRLDLKR